MGKESSHNHDQNFKNLILDYPEDSIRFFAPKEADLPWNNITITPIRQEQLKEKLGDRFRELDVPLLIEYEDGQKEGMIFAFEEESRSRRFSIKRLAIYCLDLAELLHLNRIVPVVIFLQPADNVPKEIRLGIEAMDYLHFHYLYCDLPKLSFYDWQHSQNIVARLNLPNMQYNEDDKLLMYKQAATGLLELEDDLRKQDKYIDFIDYYAEFNDSDYQAFDEAYGEEEKNMPSIKQFWKNQAREEGELKGRQEGELKGRQEGEQQTLIRQLKRRFGDVPADYKQRILQANTSQLEHWLDNILDADSIETVFQ